MNVVPLMRARPRGRVNVPAVTLAHGGGGKAMKDLIDDVFVGAFDNPMLAPLEDQARFDIAALAARGDRLAFTTNSFVVDPLFFPGGDIGRLAVCGTVNDLAVGGAVPLYLSCAMIIEEGVTIELLRRVAQSMARAAEEAGVAIATGDTKVVEKGACDKLFITTTGVGVIAPERDLGAHKAQAGRCCARQRAARRPRRGDPRRARRHGARNADRERLRAAQRPDRGADQGGARPALHARRDARRRCDGAERDRCRVCRSRSRSTRRRRRSAGK